MLSPPVTPPRRCATERHHKQVRDTDLEKELSKTSVYSPGLRTFISPWMVSLWELQRVSGISTWRGKSWSGRQSAPAADRTPAHLGLLQWRLSTLPVDHAEGDALGFRGERPCDGGAGAAHGELDGAVTAGLDEELSGALPKP